MGSLVIFALKTGVPHYGKPGDLRHALLKQLLVHNQGHRDTASAHCLLETAPSINGPGQILLGP